ncbi:MAG TPA: polysaccharide deacetylase family protein [Gemmatimonadales bacterium]|nr:polysaccharide deacetylase family protein [Gemmatimonadales bacterium]
MIETVAAVGLSAAGLAAYGAYAPNSPIYGRSVGHGPRDGRRVYLTFDDGPSPSATARILDVLAAERVPAAFFMVGDFVRRMPALARAVSEAGHEVGNHTQTHIKLHRRGPGRIRRELEEAHGVISEAAGKVPRTFRAPHGYRNPFVGRTVMRLRYTLFGWTFGVWDSARPGAGEIRSRVRRKLSAGSIILLHDGDGYDFDGDRTQTADALPGIIHDARDAGYEFAPLGELI